MASINGVSIKAFKKFRGHEGEELYQGNVYYNGKKLGFWSQDAHGGICDNFEFDETVLELTGQQVCPHLRKRKKMRF